MPHPTSLLLSSTRLLPTTLPRLLASLPTTPTSYPTASSSTQLDPILVQPVEWKERFPNSFYRVYKAKIRVKAQRQSGSGKRVTQEEVKKEKKEDDLFAVEEEVVDEVKTLEESEVKKSSGLDQEVKAYGKVWGVLFWNGEAKFPFQTQYPLSPTLIRQRYPHVITTSLPSPTSTSTTDIPSIPSLPTPYVPSTLIRPQLSARSLTSAPWQIIPLSSLSEEVRERVKATHSGPRIDGMFADRDWSVENFGKSRKDNLKLKMKQRREEKRIRE